MAISTDFSVFATYLWSPRVTEQFREKLVLGKFMTDLSAEVRREGERLYVPTISTTFTIGSIKTTSGDVTATNISDTSFYLDVDNWVGGGFYISKFQEAQIRKSYRAQARYVDRLAFDAAKYLETDLWTLTTSTYVSDVVGDSATSILATSLEKAIAIAESNSIPIGECAFFFHPKPFYQEVLANSDLRQAYAYGKPVLPTLTQKGDLYGIPVYVSELVPAGVAGAEGGHRNGLYHRELIAYAVQEPIQVKELKGEYLRTKVVVDMIYGKKALRSNAGVRIISKN